MGFSEKFKWSRSQEISTKLAYDDASSTMETNASYAPTLIPGKDAEFGTMTAIKTFYEGKNSGHGYFDWVDSPPKQLAKKVARAHDRVAIKVFKVKDVDQPTMSGRTPLKIHSIEVQSPLLVAALKDMLKDEKVFLEATETAKFEEPFKPLFFCHDKIMAVYRDTQTESVLKQHLRLLVQVMGELFGSFMAQLKNLRASELISYKLAWTYFPMGCVVYSGAQDCTRVCRVTDTNYQGHPFNRMAINCEQLSFDGDKFDWEPFTLHIPTFSGNVPVSALPCFPLSFHPKQAMIKEKLVVRAKKVLGYQELHYLEYNGIGIHVEGIRAQKHNVRAF